MSFSLATEIASSWKSNSVDTNRWIELGAGVSRIVYRGPDGNAYKVPFGWERSDLNLHEAAVSAWCRKTFPIPGVIWPDFVCHNVEPDVWVSEVTCFTHDDSVKPQAMRSLELFLQVFGINDAVAGRNIFACKGFIVPIDLGFHGMCHIDPWAETYWEGRGTTIETAREFLEAVARDRRACPPVGRCNCSICRPPVDMTPEPIQVWDESCPF